MASSRVLWTTEFSRVCAAIVVAHECDISRKQLLLGTTWFSSTHPSAHFRFIQIGWKLWDFFVTPEIHIRRQRNAIGSHIPNNYKFNFREHISSYFCQQNHYCAHTIRMLWLFSRGILIRAAGKTPEPNCSLYIIQDQFEFNGKTSAPLNK